MDTENEDDDARATELESLEAIFPELRRLDPRGFAFEMEIPVAPAAPVTVLFPAATEAEDSLQVAHLPPLSCRIDLPDGYPSACAPLIKISTTPHWLPLETVARLEDEGPRLWEEMGRDLVAYTYIDHVQRAADDVFGAVSREGTLEVDPQHKLAVIDYDIKAKRAAFERETFECGVCLDPKKGYTCHKMLDCGHIFCLQCLGDFYNDAIQAGNLSTVRCLAPNCAKERVDSGLLAAKKKKKKKPGSSYVSPSELLQMGLTEETVRRYVNLRYKTELESDKDTVYCPRQWCNGAARSKRHKKPSGLAFSEQVSDDDDDDEDDSESKQNGGGRAGQGRRINLLGVCEECGLAFCSRCFQSWHGEFYLCAPRRENGEMTEEDKASLEYLKLHTSPCPTCSAPAQKTHGCNHMICSRCDTHFCYLCSAWLDPGNPYQHYNQQPNGKVTSCYMRLWELEEGDGDGVGLDFAGGARVGELEMPEAEGEDGVEQVVVDDEAEDEHGHDNGGDGERAGRLLPENNQRHVAVAREAPLVLRLMENNDNMNIINNNQPPRLPPPNQVRGRGDGGARLRGRAPNGRGGLPMQQQAGHARGRADARAGGRGGGAVPGARGRGGGGGGGGGGGRRRNRNQNQNQNDEPRGQGIAEGLDAQQEAWIRHFVQMALVDAEDEMDEGEWAEHGMIVN